MMCIKASSVVLRLIRNSRSQINETWHGKYEVESLVDSQQFRVESHLLRTLDSRLLTHIKGTNP